MAKKRKDRLTDLDGWPLRLCKSERLQWALEMSLADFSPYHAVSSCGEEKIVRFFGAWRDEAGQLLGRVLKAHHAGRRAL
jgi:hypothetical protein